MPARYLVVDVFAREPLAGNALAVFPDPGSVAPDRMQRIARELNLSETTFVGSVGDGSYDVRIFTPTEELPFAGHPTLCTAWVLRHLGAIGGDHVIQRSSAGETPVSFEGKRVWLERGGQVGPDMKDVGDVLEALDIEEAIVGCDASAFGGSEPRMLPAVADAGVPQLMLPLVDGAAVECLRAPTKLGHVDGVYCFAPLSQGRVKARFFAPGLGVMEDPATGSAAAALGLYLGSRIGEVDLEIEQGREIGRPSSISLQARPGLARVGGQVHLALDGTLI